jgi:hypothetical protein
MYLLEPIQPIVDGLGGTITRLAEWFRARPGMTVSDALGIDSRWQDENEFDDDDLDEQYGLLVESLMKKLNTISKQRMQEYPRIQHCTLDAASRGYRGPDFFRRRELYDVLGTTVSEYSYPLFAELSEWMGCTLAVDYQDVADYGENFRSGSVLSMRNRSIPSTPEARTAIRKLLGMRGQDGTRRFRHIDIVGNPVVQPDFVQSLTDDERVGLVYKRMEQVTDADVEHVAYYELDFALRHPPPA